jgi:excisionase family DNA binding protein
MNAGAALPSLEQLREASRAEKVTRAWQDALWAHWPVPAQWPAVMDLCEAAAYKRLHPATLRKLCAEAKVRHQRIGAAYRLNRADLDAWGLVEPIARATEVAVGGGQ